MASPNNINNIDSETPKTGDRIAGESVENVATTTDVVEAFTVRLSAREAEIEARLAAILNNLQALDSLGSLPSDRARPVETLELRPPVVQPVEEAELVELALAIEPEELDFEAADLPVMPVLAAKRAVERDSDAAAEPNFYELLDKTVARPTRLSAAHVEAAVTAPTAAAIEAVASVEAVIAESKAGETIELDDDWFEIAMAETDMAALLEAKSTVGMDFVDDEDDLDEEDEWDKSRLNTVQRLWLASVERVLTMPRGVALVLPLVLACIGAGTVYLTSDDERAPVMASAHTPLLAERSRAFDGLIADTSSAEPEIGRLLPQNDAVPPAQPTEVASLPVVMATPSVEPVRVANQAGDVVGGTPQSPTDWLWPGSAEASGDGPSVTAEPAPVTIVAEPAPVVVAAAPAVELPVASLRSTTAEPEPEAMASAPSEAEPVVEVAVAAVEPAPAVARPAAASSLTGSDLLAGVVPTPAAPIVRQSTVAAATPQERTAALGYAEDRSILTFPFFQRNGQTQARSPSSGIQAGTATTTMYVNMRSKPQNGSSTVVIIPSGVAVNVVGCQLWCEVMYDGKRGYVFPRFLAQR